MGYSVPVVLVPGWRGRVATGVNPRRRLFRPFRQRQAQQHFRRAYLRIAKPRSHGVNGILRKGAPIMATPTLDWSDCLLVEVIPGKVSGAPLLKNTRLPVDAITGNYDAFRDEGLSPDAAIAETLDCYPEAGLDTIKAILSYRAAHQFQA
jgi:uncharacterized protein (DUF433 family)